MVSGSVGAVVASVGTVVGTVVGDVVGAEVGTVVGAVVGSVFLVEELEPLLEEIEEAEVFFGVVALVVSEVDSSEPSVSDGSVTSA